MALPFNPFEKGKSGPKSANKKSYTKVKIFERAEFETAQVEANREPTIVTAPINIESSQQEATQTKASNEAASKPNLNQVQTRFEPGSNLVQSWSNHGSTIVEDNDGNSKPGSQPGLNQVQSWSNHGSKAGNLSEISRLSQTQRKILKFLFDSCVANRSDTTPPIQGHQLAELTRTKLEGTRTALKRMMKVGIVQRKEFKDGRGGWTTYRLPKTVYDRILIEEKSINHGSNQVQSWFNHGPQPRPQPRSEAPSSSRDLLLNNSTTTEAVENSDADASEIFDFSTVTEFGITSSTVNRCKELYPLVSNDQLCALIERFGKFMKTPDGKRVQNARGFFISLAEQLSKGVTPLDHIETREEALMREFVERAKEAKARRELLEKEAFEFAFEEWVETLDSKKRDELVPPNSVIESGSKIQTMQLKEYFRQNVWPTRFTASNKEHGAEV